MENGDLEKKLTDLTKEFGNQPHAEGEQLVTVAKQTDELHSKLKKSVNNLQESLDYLRMLIKYQLFDLEATRRENQYLKKLLESKDNPSDNSNPDNNGWQ